MNQAFALASYQYPYVPSGDHTTYDVIAKLPAGVTPKQFQMMLQSLLVERFKLAYHFEKKESRVYELVIAKGGSKLKESPLESPSANQDEFGVRLPSPDFTGSVMQRIGENGRWVARGVTTAQMANTLASRLQRPVTNSTGLELKYDFTLYFSAESAGFSPGPSLGKAGKQIGETDEVFPPIFVMLGDKLGLQLDQRQGYIDLFVVDHVEKIPTAN